MHWMELSWFETIEDEKNFYSPHAMFFFVFVFDLICLLSLSSWFFFYLPHYFFFFVFFLDIFSASNRLSLLLMLLKSWVFIDSKHPKIVRANKIFVVGKTRSLRNGSELDRCLPKQERPWCSFYRLIRAYSNVLC